MALLVGIVVVGLLLFMVAELVFGPGLAVLLTGLCGLGLGGGAGFAGGIVLGLVGLVGSAILRGLFVGLAPDTVESYPQQPSAVPARNVPQYTAPPVHGPSASTLPTPVQSGAMPDATSWQNAPTPLVARGSVPAERPQVNLPGLSLVHATPPRAPAPPVYESVHPVPVQVVGPGHARDRNRRGPSTTAPTPVEVRKTKGRAP